MGSAGWLEYLHAVLLVASAFWMYVIAVVAIGDKDNSLWWRFAAWGFCTLPSSGLIIYVFTVRQLWPWM